MRNFDKIVKAIEEAKSVNITDNNFRIEIQPQTDTVETKIYKDMLSIKVNDCAEVVLFDNLELRVTKRDVQTIYEFYNDYKSILFFIYN